MTDQPPSERPGAGFEPAQRSTPFEMLLSLLNSVGTLWIFALMIVISLDVLGRTVFNSPLPGVLELVRLSIVGIVFIQLGHTLRANRMTRADNLIRIVQRRYPRFGYGLQALFETIGAAIFLILLHASWPFFVRSWNSGEYAGIEGYITYPVWPVRLIILVGSACAAAQFLIAALRDFRAAYAGRAPNENKPESPESLAYGAED